MIIVLLALLGLCLGSFTNALVWRLHEQAIAGKKAKQQDLSIVHGRSMCPHCHHELAAKDLIPVLSWLELRGKCRYCAKPISWQYPLIELLTAVLFVLLYLLWPTQQWTGAHIIDFGVWLGLIVGFAALTIYDIRWMELPDKIVFTLLGLVTVNVFIQSLAFHGGLTAFLGAFWGLLVIGGLFYALFQVSAGKWIGGGDVKLGFALGIAVTGPLSSFLVLFIASVAGLLGSIPLLIASKGNLKSRIPFGPFLILATVLVKLFGASLIHWYKTKLMIGS
jgi:leader peptidase (prepilin peptidase)/N-methyltransferase